MDGHRSAETGPRGWSICDSKTTSQTGTNGVTRGQDDDRNRRPGPASARNGVGAASNAAENRRQERRLRRIGRISGCDSEGWGMAAKAARITGAGRPLDMARMPKRHVPQAGGRIRSTLPPILIGRRRHTARPRNVSPGYLFGPSLRHTAPGSCGRPFPVRDTDPMLQGRRPGAERDAPAPALDRRARRPMDPGFPARNNR